MICKVKDNDTLIYEFEYYQLTYTSFYRIFFFDKTREYFVFPEEKPYTLELYDGDVLFKTIHDATFFVFKLYRGGRIFVFFLPVNEWRDNNDSRAIIEWNG